MATMTISIPESLGEWVETRLRRGDYASANDLIGRDHERLSRSALSIEDLREIVETSRASGQSGKSIADIFQEAKANVH